MRATRVRWVSALEKCRQLIHRNLALKGRRVSGSWDGFVFKDRVDLTTFYRKRGKG